MTRQSPMKPTKDPKKRVAEASVDDGAPASQRRYVTGPNSFEPVSTLPSKTSERSAAASADGDGGNKIPAGGEVGDDTPGSQGGRCVDRLALIHVLT